MPTALPTVASAFRFAAETIGEGEADDSAKVHFVDALALTDFFLTGKDVAIQKIQCQYFGNKIR